MRASLRHFALAWLIGIAGAVPGLARAEDHAPTDYPACANGPSKEDSDRASDAARLGKRFFDEADYARAIRDFSDAYKLDCSKVDLLTNIALAYELDGRRPEAVHALRTYLERAHDATEDDKAKVRKHIENLETPPPPPRGHTALPWIAASVGVVAALVGGPLFLVEDATQNRLASRCVAGSGPNGAGVCVLKDPSSDPFHSTDSDYSDAHSFALVGATLFLSGLAVAAGGVVWHFLEPTDPKPPIRAALVPVVAPGYTGFSLAGAF